MNEQKIIEVLEKLVGTVEELHMHQQYINDGINSLQDKRLSECADLLTELKLSVSQSDTSTQQSQ